MLFCFTSRCSDSAASMLRTYIAFVSRRALSGSRRKSAGEKELLPIAHVTFVYVRSGVVLLEGKSSNRRRPDWPVSVHMFHHWRDLKMVGWQNQRPWQGVRLSFWETIFTFKLRGFWRWKSWVAAGQAAGATAVWKPQAEETLERSSLTAGQGSSILFHVKPKYKDNVRVWFLVQARASRRKQDSLWSQTQECQTGAWLLNLWKLSFTSSTQPQVENYNRSTWSLRSKYIELTNMCLNST